MVFEHEKGYPSRRTAICSIADKVDVNRDPAREGTDQRDDTASNGSNRMDLAAVTGLPPHRGQPALSV